MENEKDSTTIEKYFDCSQNIITTDATHLILLGDIHFGVRSSSEEWQQNQSLYFNEYFINALKHLLKNAGKNIKYALLCLGDVFDDRKHIDIAVNDMAIEIFTRLSKMLQVIIINGNHDLYKKTSYSGITSLRSLNNIDNLTIVTRPSVLKFSTSGKQSLLIPYLGNFNDEETCLSNNNGDFAFMHTDISSMRYDNGQAITKGVNPDAFNGTIISGHIHKRQQSAKCLYVGTPYQMSRSDIGNDKGFYILDIANKSLDFVQNDYSPAFKKIRLSKYLAMTDLQQNEFLNNSYVDILVDNDIEFDIYDIYLRSTQAGAKRVQVQYIATQEEINVSEENLRDISIEEMIYEMIDGLDETNEDDKSVLKRKSSEYLKAVEA